jgi:hypothetical protein
MATDQDGQEASRPFASAIMHEIQSLKDKFKNDDEEEGEHRTQHCTSQTVRVRGCIADAIFLSHVGYTVECPAFAKPHKRNTDPLISR